MNYDQLLQSLDALCQGVSSPVTLLSNASALLFSELDNVNWAGFYLLENNELLLGPFQGRPACVRIPLGKGVCGTAALQRQTLVVNDVHSFPGHIACDASSRSEIVVPLLKNDRLLGVLDVDSPSLARFNDADARGLEAFARTLCSFL